MRGSPPLHPCPLGRATASKTDQAPEIRSPTEAIPQSGSAPVLGLQLPDAGGKRGLPATAFGKHLQVKITGLIPAVR
jgi:hypothetical protein